MYNQHHLHFYTIFNKNTIELESDSPETNQILNVVLSKALVDNRQSRWADSHLTNHEAQRKELPQDGHLVTLAATVEERFVNTLISGDCEPDYVPLTTNLGLKYRDVCSTSIGFWRTNIRRPCRHGSAFPEADLRENRILFPQSII